MLLLGHLVDVKDQKYYPSKTAKTTQLSLFKTFQFILSLVIDS